MKKTFSMFLSVIMLLTFLFVPISVSAQTPDWDAVLDDRYVFDFTDAGYFTDQIGGDLDLDLPWKETVTFDAGQGRGNKTLYPVYTLVSGNNWGPQSWYMPGSVTVNEKEVNTLELHADHNANDYFVPLKADGTPLELAPGHKYSVKVTYYVDTVVDGAPMMEYCAGLYMDGALDYNYSTNENPLKFAGGRFAWFTGNEGQTVDANLTLDLTSLASDANYDIATNTYNLSGKTLHNYFYFAITNGKAVADIISLEITRDDWTPDWEAELEDKYVFDFSDYGYYSDVPNKDGQSTIDPAYSWTYAPVSIDPGLGRANRNIYPTYGTTSTAGWGPQVYAWPESIVYNDVATDTAAVKYVNPASFIPLKKDGTPLELVPGHSYTVKGTLVKKSFAGDSNGTLTASAGYPSGGYTTATSISSVDLCTISVNAGSEGQTINFYGTLTVPAATEYGYNAGSNTFTNNSTEYYNYFFFELKGYPKAQLNFISLEVIRDDYVEQGTVEYIDEDGSILKTVTANVGDYAVDYTLEDTADKVFDGWYLDEDYNTAAGSTVALTEAGVKLYAKWREIVDWSEELSQYYKFDISSMGNYSDEFPTDTTKEWIIAPVTIDAGFDRGNRKIYPTYANTTPVQDWKDQAIAYRSTTTYNGKEVDAITFSNGNPGIFTPLKSDGKPFEFAPGHTYKIKYSYEVVNIKNGTPILQVCSGIASDGTINVKQIDGLYYNTISVNCINSAWAASDNGKGILEKECNITIPAADSENYNALENSYSVNVDGVDYNLYNYLYFYMGNYGQASINFVNIEVLRDDYVPMSTVNYVEDSNGTVKETRTVNMGTEFAIDYIPENTADKYFAGWYLDEGFTQKVTTATVNVDKEVFNIYAKWENYKDSITTTNPSYYYGAGNFPHFSNSEYRVSMSTQSHNSSVTTYRRENNVAAFTTTFWMDGMLITAFDDTTGELFRAENNTTYRVSLKFRITSETTRDDGLDIRIIPGAGLNAASNYPKGKYYDETNLKDGGKPVDYINDGVTPEGELLSYVGMISTGEFETQPAIGVSVLVYQNAGIEIYELKVEKLYGEEIVDGNLLVSNSVSNNQSYKLNFNYVLKNALTEDIGIGFKTVNIDGIGYPTFIEGENTPVYTISAAKAAAVEHNATVLLTTDMYASIIDGEGCDDTLTALNSILYAYFIGDVDTDNIIIYNLNLTAVYNTSGNALIGVAGGQCLNDEAELLENGQAVRYSFSYDSRTGNEIYIDGVAYTVKERGFIYANGNNYAVDGRYVGDMNLTSANNSSKYLVISKTSDFDSCWAIEDIADTAYYSLKFSTYVTGFLKDDTKELMAKAYVVVEVDGQEFTLYSNSINRSVTYIKSVNDSTIDPTERRLVWGYDFNKVESIDEVGAFHQNNNRNNFEKNETYNPVVGGENFVVEDGALKLKITKGTEDSRYNSPITVSTKDKMSFKYGYLELEATVPYERGIHAAYWFINQDEFVNAGAYEKVNSEINVFEVDGIYNAADPTLSSSSQNAVAVSNAHKWYHYYAADGISQLTGTSNISMFHYNNEVDVYGSPFGNYKVTDNKYVFKDLATARTKHRYGLEWTPEYVAFYVDPVVVNGTPVSEPYFKFLIDDENYFYTTTSGHENSKTNASFHKEHYMIFSFCPRTSYSYAYGGDYNNAAKINESIIDLAADRFGGDSIDFSIHSIKLYQREGETLTVNY